MEKAKDADAFAFSLDGSATFAIVRNKGDFLKKIRGSGCPHFFLDHGVFEAKVLCSWHEGTACSGFFPKKKTAGHGTSWRNGDFMIKTEHQETAMKRYFSGEEIEIGDHITTDGGEDHNVILKIIDSPAVRDDYGLDCFGALMSSSQTGGIIFVSFDEICSPDTRLLHRKTSDDHLTAI
ncbi:hypothetical protein [Akkermansia sp.]|uniref:hypothetical protein n=5 Tax=Akkermansiaceae TaxID=1647988 RepID=UPI003AF7872A